jgi:hypothetical protein
MIVTIHQPNFIPWYPYFQKIEQADVFVLLGHCQYEKNGYQNRFYLENFWNTLSVKKGLENIVDKKYINPTHDWGKLKKRSFKYSHLLSELDNYITDDLYTTNKLIIQHFIKKLGINTKFVEDFPLNVNSTERLITLCQHYGATTYLAGQGGKDYLDETLFNKAGIKVVYQENLNRIHTLEYLNQ